MDIKDYYNKISNFKLDTKGLLLAANSVIDTERQLRFRNEVDPSGKKWADISYYNNDRKKYRSSLSGNDKILQDTGLMKNSFNYKISNNTLSIGNNQNYFEQHQLGKGAIKKRAMLDTEGVNKQEQAAIKDILQKGLEDQLKILF